MAENWDVVGLVAFCGQLVVIEFLYSIQNSTAQDLLWGWCSSCPRHHWTLHIWSCVFTSQEKVTY